MSEKYFGVHRRLSAYLERTRRMPNVPLTYISVCERMSIYSHTLLSYAVEPLYVGLTFILVALM